jgi:hypothetical protein
MTVKVLSGFTFDTVLGKLGPTSKVSMSDLYARVDDKDVDSLTSRVRELVSGRGETITLADTTETPTGRAVLLTKGPDDTVLGDVLDIISEFAL